MLNARWDQLTKWLAAVSSPRPVAVDASRIPDLDGWIARMADDGIFIGCSQRDDGQAGAGAELPVRPRLDQS